MAESVVKGCCVGRFVLAWVPRVLVAALFLYTGVTKIRGLDQFVKEIRAYQIIPVWSSNLGAYVLPWLEVFTAVLLLIGLWRREARLLLVLMLVVFAAAKTYVLAQGHSLEGCGCVPTDSFLYFLFKDWVGVGTNLVLILLLGIEACAGRRHRPTTPATEQA